MAIQFSLGQWVPVRKIRTFVGGACGALVGLEQIRSALTNWHVSFSELTTMDDIRAAVNQRGHIVISPVQMSDLSRGEDFEQPKSDPSKRQNVYKNPGPHFVVIKGITSDNNWVTAYDPNVFDNPIYYYSDNTPKGEDRLYDYTEFTKGFADLTSTAFEIMAGPASGNIHGIVKDQATGQPISGATVVLTGGRTRGQVVKTGANGGYNFTFVVQDTAIVTAIRGNKIGFVRLTPGTNQDVRIAPTASQHIIIPQVGKMKATFISTGSPGDQTACSGTFSLQTPAQEIIFPDYLFYEGLSGSSTQTFDQGTELTFAITPTSFCAGATYLSTDPQRAVIAQIDPTTWVIGWEDYIDVDFNDLVVLITIEATKSRTFDPPISQASRLTTLVSTVVIGSLPPIDALMDHRYPISEAGDATYSGTVIYRGDDSNSPGPFTSPVANITTQS